MKRADFCVGAIVMGVGLLFAYGSLQLPTVEGILMGPGSMPLGLGVCLAVLGLVLMLCSGLGQTQDRAIPWPRGTELQRILLVALSFTFYVIIVSVLGYLVSTLLTLVMLVRVMGSFHWRFTVSISLAVTIAAYFVFQIWLQIPLPSGIVDL